MSDDEDKEGLTGRTGRMMARMSVRVSLLSALLTVVAWVLCLAHGFEVEYDDPDSVGKHVLARAVVPVMAVVSLLFSAFSIVSGLICRLSRDVRDPDSTEAVGAIVVGVLTICGALGLLFFAFCLWD